MTYEQIAEMMEEMGLPFAYHHYAEGESPEPPFCCFSLLERIHFQQIMWHISVANSWTLNCTRIKNCRNWKNKWRQCLPSMKFITQKQNYSLIRKNCMKYSMRWMPESEAGCCTRTNGMPTLDFRRLVYIWQWRKTR